MELSGRIALVTGGGRGIGEAIVRRLAREGLRVAVAGRSRAELERVAAEVHGLAVTMDVAERASLAAGLAVVERELGPVDVLVNNAGVAESAPLERTTDEVWDRALAVNVTAVFWLCRAVLPGMLARGFGRVVNVASNAGLRGYAYTAAYCASKHAVVGLTRALALETARANVTVNAVCPGFVDTAMAARAADRIARTTGREIAQARAALEALSPQKRLMTAEEVAHLVCALLPHEARGIHGQALALDGGQSA